MNEFHGAWRRVTSSEIGRPRARCFAQLRWVVIGWLLVLTPALADDVVDPARLQAREMFIKGAERVKDGEWGEALAAFEASSQALAHATTTFNIGACERALSRYTRARVTFMLALDQARQRPDQLPDELASEARGFIEQIDALLAHVQVTLVPADAQISVDGRPLHLRTDMGPGTTLVAGLERPGKGARPPRPNFDLVLDPGPHVITLSRQGYSDIVVNRSFGPNTHTRLPLELALLPATLHVESVPRGAIVTVDGKDFGPAPVDVLRDSGTYHVLVQKGGFEPADNQVTVRAGEESTLRATLVPERQAITRRWWFWAGAAAVVAGGVVLTYALTRSEPQPPPYNGGSTGWVATPSTARLQW